MHSPVFDTDSLRCRLPDAQNGCRLDATSMTVDYAPKSAVIVHPAGTGHFECACGKRLVFGTEGGALGALGALTVLIEQRRQHGCKIGRCPRCGQVHEVPQGQATPTRR